MVQRDFSMLVVGQGSIGTRHRDVLRELGHTVSTVSRRSGVGQFGSISEGLSSTKFDAAIVATETSRHVSDLIELERLNYQGVVLVEKPLCANPDELNALHSSENIFVGYNLRFLPVAQTLRAALARESSAVISAQLHAAQALDTWRPGRQRETVYSAHRDLGGGILRDLSHELDLATWLFGPVERVTAIGGRYSEQTVDSDDAWSILAICRGCPQVMITINGIDKPARRFIAVTTAAQTYHANLIDGVLCIGETTQPFLAERNESYRRMWQAILGNDKSRSSVCTFEEGAVVMRLIAAIEVANERRCWIELGR